MTPASFTCTMCWRTSYHPKDVEDGFCGRCHQYVPGVTVRDLSYQPGRAVTKGESTVIVWPDGAVSFGRHRVQPNQVENWQSVLRVASSESRRIRSDVPATGPGLPTEGTEHDHHHRPTDADEDQRVPDPGAAAAEAGRADNPDQG